MFHRKQVSALFIPPDTQNENDQEVLNTNKPTKWKHPSWAILLFFFFALLPVILWKPTTVQPTVPTSQEPHHRLAIPPIKKQKEPQSQQEKISTTTTLLDTGDSISSQQPPAPSFQKKQQPLISNKKHVDYHLVFSTSCNLFQDWQSYAFFYHAHKSGQKGNITRIASGCTPEQTEQLQQAHETTIQTISSRFRLHFTPDFSKIKPGKNYKYFNKPFALKHWMENVLGYPHNTKIEKKSDTSIDDIIVILMDPDQLIFKPLTHDYTDINMKWIQRRSANRSKAVKHGTTIAQQYGYQNQWLTKVNLSHLLSNDTATRESPLWKLSPKTASKYAAGPPYFATASDMYSIVEVWADFAPRVHADYPSLLAEMFAFSLAAYHVHRHPQTSTGFMISDVGGGEEGWHWVEEQQDFLGPNFCPRQYPPNNVSHPFVLHYCNHYYWKNISFVKYYMKHKFLRCGSNLLREPENLPVNKKSYQDAYVLCTLIPALNEAAEYYKRLHCRQDNSTNYQKIQVLKRFYHNQSLTWDPNN
jgi:hypothetical protein